jgi:hypothetical protein
MLTQERFIIPFLYIITSGSFLDMLEDYPLPHTAAAASSKETLQQLLPYSLPGTAHLFIVLNCVTPFDLMPLDFFL